MIKEALPYSTCPLCGTTGFVSKVSRPEIATIRGLDITVDRVFRRCEKCENEFENSRDKDWKQDAYAAYRAKRKMRTPDEIKRWRKTYNLTQQEVTQLLGWGEVTLGRYENGALQSEAHHIALSNLMKLEGLAQALEESPEVISDSKRKQIMEDIRAPLAQRRARQMLDVFASSARIDIYTGNQVFDAERTSALIALLSDLGEFKTKLNKLLFYADFRAFRELGKSITGMRYACITFGPVPNDYDIVFASVAGMGVVVAEPWEKYDRSGEIIKDRRTISPQDFLNADEIEIASYVKRYFFGWTPTKIMKFSHNEKAWQENEIGSLISFEHAKSLQIF